MNRRPRLICDCGGEIQRPIPNACPHCGAVITNVKRSLFRPLLSLALIITMAGGLIFFMYWWTTYGM